MRTFWPAVFTAAAIVLTPAAGWAQDVRPDRADSLRAEVERLRARMDSLEARLGAVPAQAADTSAELAELRAAAGVPPGDSVPQVRRARSRARRASRRQPAQPRDQRHGRHPPGRPRRESADRQRDRARVRVLLPVGARSVLQDQDLPHLRERGGRGRGGLHLLDRPSRRHPRRRRQVPPADRRPQPLAPARACPRPSTPSSTSASSARKDWAGSGCRSTRRCRSRSPAGRTRSGSRAPRPRASRSTPAAASPPCSAGCRTSGSSPAATYAQIGFTATGGNNSDADLKSRLLGLDFRFTYRPPRSRDAARRHASGPRGTGSTRPSWASSPTGTAPSSTSRRGQPPLDLRRALRLGRDAARAGGHRVAHHPGDHLVAERVRLPAAPGRASPTATSTARRTC